MRSNLVMSGLAGRVRLPRSHARARMWPGSHYRPRGANFDEGINAHKRSIPSKRKHRVRLRASLAGRLNGRPLTAYERSWLR